MAFSSEIKIKMENNFSIEKGLDQLTRKDYKIVRQELMTALGIKTRSGWSRRVHGKIEPKVSEARKMAEIFGKRGIVEFFGN
jgi:hypothetical protein